jgi:hypothetical protein
VQLHVQAQDLTTGHHERPARCRSSVAWRGKCRRTDMTLQHSAACHANQSCVSTELAVRIRDTLPAGKTLSSSHSWPGIQNPSLPIQLPGHQEDGVCMATRQHFAEHLFSSLFRLPMHMLQAFNWFGSLMSILTLIIGPPQCMGIISRQLQSLVPATSCKCRGQHRRMACRQAPDTLTLSNCVAIAHGQTHMWAVLYWGCESLKFLSP